MLSPAGFIDSCRDHLIAETGTSRNSRLCWTAWSVAGIMSHWQDHQAKPFAKVSLKKRKEIGLTTLYANVPKNSFGVLHTVWGLFINVYTQDSPNFHPGSTHFSQLEKIGEIPVATFINRPPRF